MSLQKESARAWPAVSNTAPKSSSHATTRRPWTTFTGQLASQRSYSTRSSFKLSDEAPSGHSRRSNHIKSNLPRRLPPTRLSSQATASSVCSCIDTTLGFDGPTCPFQEATRSSWRLVLQGRESPCPSRVFHQLGSSRHLRHSNSSQDTPSNSPLRAAVGVGNSTSGGGL